MESAIRYDQFRKDSNRQSPLIQRKPCFRGNPLLLLNEELDNLKLPHFINEPSIERLLKILEDSGASDQPCYWLVMARLFELALLCAGHYADNAEFSAAGDLLVNPRKVLIHQKNRAHSLVKQRHGKISDQLNTGKKRSKYLLLLLKHEVSVEIAEPALLPHLFEKIQYSKKMAPWYLHTAEQRMKKIAATIGFLSAWTVLGFEDLHNRLQETSPKTVQFVADHLCRFDTHYFERLGREIQKIIKYTNGTCEFLRINEYC